MELSVEVENTSAVLKILKIRVPAKTVAKRFESGLAEVQKTAKLKGFRQGQVPINVVKQYYGDDVRHRVFHNLIDESYRQAIREGKIFAVGSPRIETPEHQTGGGEHDHTLQESKDLTYTATVEVIPEIEVKGYAGIPLVEGKVEVTPADVETAIRSLQEANAQLEPVGSGLLGADGVPTSRPAEKGDFVDIAFQGALLTASGREERDGMKGNRVVEIGSDSLIPGFEEQIVGMRSGQKKTFEVPFPEDFHEKDMAGRKAEFTVTLNEVKVKKLPLLDEDFAKQLGYEGVADMRARAEEHLIRERRMDVDRKLRSDLLSVLIEKNPFEVPQALIQAQTRSLAQDVATTLKNQGADDAMIEQLMTGDLDSLKKRAEGQVRASLLLESVARKENVGVTPEEVDAEILRMGESMKIDAPKIREFYARNPGKREDLEFRMREDRTVRLLLDKSKIKTEK